MELALAPPQVIGSDPGEVADSAFGIWREIDVCLAPVIGRRGVAALFQRSLHLVEPEYPWLLAAHSAVNEPSDFSVLRRALCSQTYAKAVAGNAALLNAFYNLLINLVGESLTRQLLPTSTIKCT